MYALLEADEETDAGAYAAYLRAQSDADLLDIQTHLDPERYPARLDSVRRETLRRHVLPVTVHTPEERAVRCLAIVALLFAGVTVLLALLLTPADAAGPRGVDFDQIPDGTPVSAILRLALVGVLRGLFSGGVSLALAPGAALALAGWLLRRAGSRAARADVKVLACAVLVALAAAFALAACPLSSVPALFDPSGDAGDFWARVAGLLRPF